MSSAWSVGNQPIIIESVLKGNIQSKILTTGLLGSENTARQKEQFCLSNVVVEVETEQKHAESLYRKYF